jgi:hypothetical protein
VLAIGCRHASPKLIVIGICEIPSGSLDVRYGDGFSQTAWLSDRSLLGLAYTYSGSDACFVRPLLKVPSDADLPWIAETPRGSASSVGPGFGRS